MATEQPEWKEMVNSSFTEHLTTRPEIDFQDSGEVWIWTRGETEVHCVQLSLRDVQSLMDEFTYVFRTEQLYEMVEEMENDPMSDAVGFTPDLSDKAGRKFVTQQFVKRLERQRHYINAYDAHVLVNEFFDGRE